MKFSVRGNFKVNTIVNKTVVAQIRISGEADSFGVVLVVLVGQIKR